MFRIGGKVPQLAGERLAHWKLKLDFAKSQNIARYGRRCMCIPAADPKAARLARMQSKGAYTASGASGSKGSFRISPKVVVGLLAVAGIGGVTYEINTNKEGEVYKLYDGSAIQQIVNWIVENTWGSFKDVFYPATDKLLPDWPTAPCYGNPFPGTPAPPVLVLSLEKCLVGSVYDAKHGWRYVKRPGVDKFLASLANYYEIVLFAETDKGNMMEVFEAIDRTGHCHKFGSAEGEIRNGVTLKRLDIMNRDVGRILVLDHSKEATQLCPRNTLLVKPFEDIYDTKDTALLDMIPLLQGFVHEDVQDFRTALDTLGTHDAQEAVEEYQMRITRKKADEMDKRNRGFGGVVRNKLGTYVLDEQTHI